MTFRACIAALLLIVPGIGSSAVIDVDFDNMALTTLATRPVFTPLTTPEGFSFAGAGLGAFGPKDIIYRDLMPGTDHALRLEVSDGYASGMYRDDGQVFDLLQMDIFVDDPTGSLRGWYYASYADSFAIVARDAADQVIAQLDISWMDGTGWRTVYFDSSWTGIARLELGVLQNCCNEVGFGEFDNIKVNVVPIPAAVWLFFSALGGLSLLRRSRNSRVSG